MKTKRENYRYEAVGLPGITLQGVEVSRCGKCGEYEIAIPRIEGLHRVIAEAVISKKDRLTAAEIRFLRKHLGWTARNLLLISAPRAKRCLAGKTERRRWDRPPNDYCE
jgi:hypothetical protein